MQQIADGLGVTRPALYYHYRSKEDILASIHDDLAYSVDDLITWAAAQPKTRGDVACTLAAPPAWADVRGPWIGTYTRFAQANEAAMRDLSAAAEFARRMGHPWRPPEPDRHDRRAPQGAPRAYRLVHGECRQEQLGGTTAQLMDAALGVAAALVR